MHIEQAFWENINFEELKKWFSELAKELVFINQLVMSIDLLEKRANTGNLFDSEKYTKSLREDIKNPLISLRSFLSTRLSELEQLKGEMQKVQVKVGWWEEALTLQSARTDPLMVELRDNIEKLDGMIEKL